MSKMKTKIQNLINKAEGTDNEHEAALFMSKAMELMQEHQIELHDLNQDDEINSTIGMTASGSAPSWKKKVMSQLARYYGCQVVLCDCMVTLKNGRFVRGYKLDLIGPESARATTEIMFPFVVKQIQAAGNRLAKMNGTKAAREQRSVGNELVFRIGRLNAENKIATEAKQHQVPGLIRTDQVIAFRDQKYANLSKGRGSRLSSGAGAAGAAGKISLSRQVGSGSSQKRIG